MKYKAYVRTGFYNRESKKLNDPAKAMAKAGAAIHKAIVDQLTNELLDSERTKDYIRNKREMLLLDELEDWFHSVLKGSAEIIAIPENRMDEIAMRYLDETTRIRAEVALRTYYASKNTTAVAEWHWLIEEGEENEEI